MVVRPRASSASLACPACRKCQIVVEFIDSDRDPGGVGEIGVPVVAPAIATQCSPQPVAESAAFRYRPIRDRTPPSHPAASAPRIGVLLVNLTLTRLNLGRYAAICASSCPTGVVETFVKRGSRYCAGHYPQHATKKPGPRLRTGLDRRSRRSPRLPGAAGALQGALGDDVRVSRAMRHGAPRTRRRDRRTVGEGCRRILIAPLYPQYCAATTATVVDAVSAHLARPLATHAAFPAVLSRRSYEIAALAASV